MIIDIQQICPFCGEAIEPEVDLPDFFKDIFKKGE